LEFAWQQAASKNFKISAQPENSLSKNARPVIFVQVLIFGYLSDWYLRAKNIPLREQA
jgi:hypothetical protein